MKEFPPFRLDPDNQCLWRCESEGQTRRILLTPKAFAILRYLVERAGRLVTQEELLGALWTEAYVQPEVLKGHIRGIRAALEDDPRSPRFIETLHRRGYQFIAPVSEGLVPAELEAHSLANKLVGRNAELNRLEEHLRKAARGERQLVFVTGEPGIGKTSLTDAFLQRARAENSNLRLARGQCVEGYGSQEPFYPVLEALAQLGHGGGRDALLRVLAVQAPTWLVQFPSLMKRDQRETLRREVIGAGRERMLREIADALEGLSSENPVVLVFEDLQWVDNSTLDVISALARRRQAAKLLLIGTYRPVDVLLAKHPLRGLKQDLLVHRLCHEIALNPLDEAGVAEYLAFASEGATIPEGLTALIHRHSEGNPLFMVAALEHLKERKIVTEEDGGWKIALPLDEVDLEAPDSLRQMIETQIGGLSPEDQLALEVASISGIAFEASVSAAAAEMEVEDFERICETLSRRHQIIRPADVRQFPDGTVSSRYEFVHAMYRQVLYRRQLPRRRAKLHTHVGRQLERVCAQRLSEAASELAHHFEEGRDWLRAAKYLQLAAEVAGHRFARREAIALLEHALSLSSKLPEAQRIETEMAILERQATMWAVSFDTLTSAVESYEFMAARAHQHGLIDAEVRALIGMAYPLHWSDSRRCVEVAERAYKLGAMQTDPLLRAKARTTCLYFRIWAGRWSSQDFQEFGSALEDLRHAADGDRAVIAMDLLGYGLLQWITSRYRGAYQAATEGFEIALEAGDQNPYFSPAYQRATLVLPWCLLFMGEWGEALREVKTSVAMMNNNGDGFRAQALQMFDAWVRLHALDFDAVRSICRPALRLFTDPARSAYARFCLILAGQAEAGLGNYEEALQHLSAARDAISDHSAPINSWFHLPQVESAITDLWLAKGDLAKARLEATRFLEVALTTEDRMWQALAWDANAQVSMAESNLKRAQECIVQALATLEGFDVPLAAWRVHATATHLYEMKGNSQAAKRHRDVSRTTILKLANSLPEEEGALRNTFLSSPSTSRILADRPSSGDPEPFQALASKECFS